MRIVDSHCHAALVWYAPVESLLFEMDRSGVAQAVLIQINGQTDNSYQEECVRRYPDRLASVVIVDTALDDAVATLERLAEAGANGVRLTPGVRSPGEDPLAIWRAAERLDLAVSCGGNAAAFAAPEFAAVVQAVPRLTIVIEHLGSVSRPTGDPQDEELRQRVFGLSRFPNTCMKIPGLGEFTSRAMPVRDPFPFREPVPNLIESAVAAFGPSRVMWGSDYPPVASREGYANALAFPKARLAHLDRADLDQIFGGTARRVFRLRA